MSGARNRLPSEYTVYNVMLPRTYYPQWQGNVFEQRCQVQRMSILGEYRLGTSVKITACLVQVIADQLQGGDMVADYDQVALADRLQSAGQSHNFTLPESEATHITSFSSPCFLLQILAKRPHSEDAVFAWHQVLLEHVND